MRLIILFLMFLLSLFSCSLRKKSSTEVTEHKTETLKEERKTDVQSVSNASTFVDSSKIVVYNDAVREIVETYKYAPPDKDNKQYIQEYTRTTRDKQSNAKQVSNASAKTEIQDSVSANTESSRNSLSKALTERKIKESVKSNVPILRYAIAFILVALVVISFWILRKRAKRFFWSLWNR
ncbi:hypothetical protein HQ36_02160 [Porphyromonas gingivicanis]|uniref:Lipoprotein n=1 Tax=Porphyromonas gingivicanis TaxID=266762 RepID=A0A0A2G5E3_9PORP|nr:hypothetical protein [Porphyromonas gingivicanis]KGN98436.1 hypothetical protein HQ36_02160 [Porphyromonas gingivicanis]